LIWVGDVFSMVNTVCALLNFTSVSSILSFRRSCIWTSQTMRFLSSHMKPSGGLFPNFTKPYEAVCRSQCPSGLWRRSVAALLLGLWDRISLGAWMFVCNGCCVLSDRILCVGLNTCPEDSCRLCRV